MLNHYTFIMKLDTSITIEAESQEEGERIIRGCLDSATAFFEGGDDELKGEVKLNGNALTLNLIDGQEIK